jgi:hypothetical protein
MPTTRMLARPIFSTIHYGSIHNSQMEMQTWKDASRYDHTMNWMRTLDNHRSAWSLASEWSRCAPKAEMSSKLLTHYTWYQIPKKQRNSSGGRPSVPSATAIIPVIPPPTSPEASKRLPRGCANRRSRDPLPCRSSLSALDRQKP